MVNQDDTVYGSFSQFMDFDYFKVTFPLDGKANFWLGNIPSDSDYDLHVYNENYNLIASSTGTTTSELISNVDVEAGETFYFRVECVTFGSSNLNFYKVRCKLNLDTYSYFCQNYPALSNISYDNKLNKLYTKTGLSWLSKINSHGCFVSSYAMLFRNLGIKTTENHYDFRNGSTQKMSADPFTVSYANVNFPSITANSDGTYTANTTSNPVYLTLTNILDAFGTSRSKYILSGLTEQEKANAIAYQLSLHPEGVLVEYETPNKNDHTIVFIGTTHETPLTYNFSLTASTLALDEEMVLDSDINSVESIENDIEQWEYNYNNKIASTRASNYDGLFTVCDPYSSSSSASGNQVIFGNSFTAYQHGFANAVSMCVINN